MAAGFVPGAIEMMDRLSIKAAEAATGAGYRLDAGAALLVELDGPEEECSTGLGQLLELCSTAGGSRRSSRAHGPGARADVEKPAGQRSRRWAGWRRRTTCKTA